MSGLAAAPRPRPLRAAAILLAGLLATLALIGLGTWQVERRAWKLDLIARVDQRLRASPVPPPAAADWPRIDANHDAYRRLRATGRFLPNVETLVQAVTERGSGYWVIVPLRTDEGALILVNRGFIPGDRRADHLPAPVGPVAVTGLLRLTEPKGGFLRSNDPGHDRWFSRDVAAIAAARHLGPVAPFFIDADATPNPGGYPLGGLTIVRFPNNHLVYALTWYGLALMVLVATIMALRLGRRPAR